MSAPEDTSAAEDTGKPKKFGRKGFKVFGLGLQDVIKYFFGGNASLAIFVLILICAFLLKDGLAFFPDYQKELREYRESGQEFVDYATREVDAHTRIYSDANIAYYAEVNRTSKEEDDVLSAYRSVGSYVKSSTSAREEQLERYEDRVESLKKDLERISEATQGEQTNPDDVNKLEIEKKKQQLVSDLSDYEERIEKLRASILLDNTALVRSKSIWESVPPGIALSTDQKALVLEAILHDQSGEEGIHPEIENLKRTSSDKKKAATAELVGFKEVITGLSSAAKPMKTFHREMKKIASENAREAKKFSTAELRYEALLKAAKRTEDEAEKARFTQQAEAVDRTAPDFETLTEPLIAMTDEHNKLSVELAEEVSRLAAMLPKEVQTESARENLKKSRANAKEYPDLAENSREEMGEWDRTENVSFFRAVRAFFLGKDWTSNSSWRDFYGVLPLFTGSLLISIIALTVAVPFSLAAAIYVNQLAGLREQNFIKPAIEFIEAIPSVVLGFFGILVLGTALRNLSQVEWLSWVPGFPMTERLTILNAGLLLAFMAVPTIFTLAEDALNNVPGALTENSLAMGASKLQTVLRVVFPASVSGVIAAVLLGFGRIIGETMVVLLVAGNKIKIPDFTKGVGVVTEPTHTMTGIIAQELGEVDQGSLHWGALFMVGLVLFFMSLAINFSAQRILKKFQKY